MADAAPVADYTKYYVIGGIAVALIGGFVVYKFVIKKPTTGGGAKYGLSSPVAPAASVSYQPVAAVAPSAPVSSAGNDYVEGAAIDKRNSGTYTSYDSSDKVADMASYTQSIVDNMGLTVKETTLNKVEDFIPIAAIFSKKRKNKRAKETADKAKTDEPYVRGFLKGMNLAARQDYVGIFAPYITKYLSSPAKLPYTQVTVGQFLTA